MSLRKLSIAICLSVALALPLSGCSSSTKTKTTATKTTLYWWRSSDDGAEAALKQVADQFKSANPNVTIEIVTKNPQKYLEEVTTALASYQTIKNAPDVISVNYQDLPNVANQLVPAADNLFEVNLSAKKKTGIKATDYVVNNFEPVVGKTAILKNSQGESKLYGLPMAIDTLALYRNKTLLASAADNLGSVEKLQKQMSKEEISILKKKIQAAPATWKELAEVVPYINVKSGDQISISAIPLGAPNIERSYDIVQTLMMQNGTRMTSDSLDSAAFSTSQQGVTSANTPGEQALDFFFNFSNPSSSLYSWNSKMPTSYDAFKNSQAAMMIHYASAYGFLVNEKPALAKNIEVVPLPQITDPKLASETGNVKTMAKMNLECVTAAKGDAKRQKLAWDFVNYVSSKTGSSPYLSATRLASPLKTNTGRPKFEAFAKQKSLADAWFKGHKASVVDEIFLKMIDDIYSQKKSKGQALNEAANQVTTILQANNIKWANSATETN